MRVSGRHGFTLIELMFVVAIIGILAGSAAPSLMRARAAANESSAMGSLRSVTQGQAMFWSTCGNGMYSPSLQNLGAPIGLSPGFIGPDLSGAVPVVKSGYEFDMAGLTPGPGASCNGGTVVTAYHVTADPQPGRGSRYFGANGGGAIYEANVTLFGTMPDSGPAPAPAVTIGH